MLVYLAGLRDLKVSLGVRNMTSLHGGAYTCIHNQLQSQMEVKTVSRQLSEQMTRISELNNDGVKQINQLKAKVRKLEEEETLQNEVQIAVCTFDLLVHVFT